MTWLENDEDSFNKDYFISRGNSDIFNCKFNEKMNDINNLNSTLLMNWDHKNFSDSSDFQIDYDEYKLNTQSNSEVVNKKIDSRNSSRLDNYQNANNCNYNNIFLTRTYFDTEILNQHLNEFEKLNYLEMSHKKRIQSKKERTKFLLSKTRRNTSDEFKESEISTDKNSAKNNSNINMKNSDIDYIKKKEIKRQKNREAAQKSRFNRQIEFEVIKENQIILEQENKNLKIELFQVKNMIEKLCQSCKKVIDNNLKIENNSSTVKKVQKFKIIQTPSTIQNSISINSNVSKYSILTGLLVIVCLIGNLFWIKSPENNNSNNNLTNKIDKRILINYYNTTSTSEENNSNIITPPYLEKYENYPQVLIDDNHNKKLFFIKFIDYFKTKNIFMSTKSNNKNNENEKVKKPSQSFLSKENKIKEACLNNKTFLINLETNKEDFHNHKEFLPKDNKTKNEINLDNDIKLEEEILCKTDPNPIINNFNSESNNIK